MKFYDLYGIKSGSLEDIKAQIEKALNIRLNLHENLNYGDYFRSAKSDGEELVLINNFDPYEKELIDESYPDYNFLLYVDDTKRRKEIEEKLIQKIKDIVLLEREEL
jgi:hypothetical protein